MRSRNDGTRQAHAAACVLASCVSTRLRKPDARPFAAQQRQKKPVPQIAAMWQFMA
jgi:hypothetical protein